MVRPACTATQGHDMLISPAYAQDISGLMASAGQFLPIVLIMGVFYFLLFRPQQQKQKQTQAMLKALKRGDRVVTGGGILGTVQRVNEARTTRSRSRSRPTCASPCCARRSARW